MARERLSVPGYTVIPKHPRRYVVAPGGEKITRYQYQKAQREYYAERYAQIRKVPKFHAVQGGKLDYYDKLDRFTRKWNAEHPNNPMTKGEARRSVEFRLAYAVHVRMRNRKHPDTRPKGEWAKALEDLGAREDWWDWEVGETPPKFARAA